MAKRKGPQKVHLQAMTGMDAPVCLTGRGPTTGDPAKVTCKGCRGSVTMSRVMLRRMQEAKAKPTRS